MKRSEESVETLDPYSRNKKKRVGKYASLGLEKKSYRGRVRKRSKKKKDPMEIGGRWGRLCFEKVRLDRTQKEPAAG